MLHKSLGFTLLVWSGLLCGEGRAAELEPSSRSGAQNQVAPEVASSYKSSEDHQNERRKPGAYLGFGLSKPTKIGVSDHFEKFYGAAPNFISVEAGYYLLSYYFDFGIISKISYAKAEGNPLKASQNITIPLKSDLPSGLDFDRSQRLELTMIPVDLRAEIGFSPFSSRRIVLRGWFGLDKTYIEETLKPKLPGSVSEANQANFLGKGWNSGLVKGAALSIALNGLEPRSDYALRSLGIDRTFVSPFVEIVNTQNERMGNFDRKSYGIGFSFESLK